jgi:hypothetical protein
MAAAVLNILDTPSYMSLDDAGYLFFIGLYALACALLRKT